MKQVKQVKLEDLVFIDTETARLQKDLVEGTPDYEAWEYMVKRMAENGEIDVKEDYLNRSGLYAEFSRLVCISVGRIKDGKLVITSYKDADEKTMLERFMGDLDEVVKYRPDTKLVGHSVKGFDIPFVFRRALVNYVTPNRLIDVGGLKPWELTCLDTKDLWKGSGYYNASLIAVCLALGIPSPKSDITGAEVGDVYHSEGEAGLTRIAEYCERDVMAVANVILRWRFEPIFEDYVSQEPREKRELGLLERIAKTGEITDEDKAEILSKVKGASIDDKEKQIKIIKASLIVSQKELDQDLELAILTA
jgi:hypothetical protein